MPALLEFLLTIEGVSCVMFILNVKKWVILTFLITLEVGHLDLSGSIRKWQVCVIVTKKNNAMLISIIYVSGFLDPIFSGWISFAYNPLSILWIVSWFACFWFTVCFLSAQMFWFNFTNLIIELDAFVQCDKCALCYSHCIMLSPVASSLFSAWIQKFTKIISFSQCPSFLQS